MQYLLGYLYSYLYVFGVIFGVTLLQKCTRMSTEISRKLIHILTGGVWIILYRYFWDSWQILVVPASFILINALSYRYKLFSAMERTDGNHLGTVYFSIGMTVLFLCALLLPKTIMASGLAVFCLCFGDGFAALVGKAVKKPLNITETKSVQGTLSCMVATFLGLCLFSYLLSYPLPLSVVSILSVATGFLELVGKGLDNFTVLFGTYALASIFVFSGAIA